MLLEVRLEEAGMRAFMVGLAPPLPHPAKPGRRPTPSADPDPDPDP
ncbi:MAG: hypothetical protein U0271_42945 [Polyangiaceae bacterium]